MIGRHKHPMIINEKGNMVVNKCMVLEYATRDGEMGCVRIPSTHLPLLGLGGTLLSPLCSVKGRQILLP